MVMPWPARSGCAAPPVTPSWIPSRVGVGATEAGAWWRLPVLGQHILVAGATGSGKGSVLWSIIAGLAPGVRADWVRLLVIDPKGGMEFGRGQTLFTGFAYDNGDNTLGLLRAVTTVMQQRAPRLRGQTRLHAPTTAEPLIVLIVDEIASLTPTSGTAKSAPKSNSYWGCCSPRAVPSVSPSSPRCRIRPKTSCRSGSCSPSGWVCG